MKPEQTKRRDESWEEHTGCNLKHIIDKINAVVPGGCAQIYAKLEWENPTGSMKDRMAQAMIAGAEADGRLKPELVDGIFPISTEDAEAMARRLAKEDGLFASTSSGANVIAAIEVGKKIGPDAVVVTLMVDSGLKYLSTDVYRN